MSASSRTPDDKMHRYLQRIQKLVGNRGKSPVMMKSRAKSPISVKTPRLNDMVKYQMFMKAINRMYEMNRKRYKKEFIDLISLNGGQQQQNYELLTPTQQKSNIRQKNVKTKEFQQIYEQINSKRLKILSESFKIIKEKVSEFQETKKIQRNTNHHRTYSQMYVETIINRRSKSPSTTNKNYEYRTPEVVKKTTIQESENKQTRLLVNVMDKILRNKKFCSFSQIKSYSGRLLTFQLKAIHQSYNFCQQNLKSADKQLSSLQKKNLQAQKEINDLKERLRSTIEKVKSLQNTYQSKNYEQSDPFQQVSQIKKLLEASNKQLERTKKLYEQLKESNEKNKNKQIKNLQEQLQTLKKNEKKLNKTIELKQNEMQKILKQNQECQKQLEKISKQNMSLLKQLQALKKETLKKENSLLKKNQQSLKKLQQRQILINEKQKQLEELFKELQIEKKQFEALKSKNERKNSIKQKSFDLPDQIKPDLKNTQIHSLQKQIQSLARKNDQLKNELKKNEKILNQQKQKIHSLNKKLSDQQNQNKIYEQQVEAQIIILKRKIVLLTLNQIIGLKIYAKQSAFFKNLCQSKLKYTQQKEHSILDKSLNSQVKIKSLYSSKNSLSNASIVSSNFDIFAKKINKAFQLKTSLHEIYSYGFQRIDYAALLYLGIYNPFNKQIQKNMIEGFKKILYFSISKSQQGKTDFSLNNSQILKKGEQIFSLLRKIDNKIIFTKIQAYSLLKFNSDLRKTVKVHNEPIISQKELKKELKDFLQQRNKMYEKTFQNWQRTKQMIEDYKSASSRQRAY